MKNKKSNFDDRISIRHEPGTTTKSGKDGEFNTLSQQFDKSRENMIQGLIKKYGENWQKVIYNSIPDDVDKKYFYDWIINVGVNAKKEDLEL